MLLPILYPRLIWIITIPIHCHIQIFELYMTIVSKSNRIIYIHLKIEINNDDTSTFFVNKSYDY